MTLLSYGHDLYRLLHLQDKTKKKLFHLFRDEKQTPISFIEKGNLKLKRVQNLFLILARYYSGINLKPTCNIDISTLFDQVLDHL